MQARALKEAQSDAMRANMAHFHAHVRLIAGCRFNHGDDELLSLDQGEPRPRRSGINQQSAAADFYNPAQVFAKHIERKGCRGKFKSLELASIQPRRSVALRSLRNLSFLSHHASIFRQD